MSSQPQTDSGTQPQADMSSQPQADSGTQPQADMNSQPQADSGTQPQADSGTQPQADSGAQPQTDMSSQLQADSGTQPQTDMSSQPQADSGTQPQKDSSTQPQKDSGTQPQADMSSQPQADSGSQPQEDSGAQPQTDMSSQPQADSGTQPQADSGAQPQTDMSSQPQADSGTQPQADSGAQPQTDMSSQPQADSGTQPQTDMSSQPQADSGTQPQKDSGTQPQADMSSQPQADSDTQPQADSGAQPQTDMSSQPQADSVTQPQADSGAQPQTDMSSQPQADSGTQPQADSGAQPQTDMSSQPQADSGTQPQTDMNSQPQADSGTQPQKDSGTQPQADMSSQPQADSDTQPQADSGTQPQTDYGTQPQTGMNSQPQADSGTQPQTDMSSQPQADSGTQPQTDSGTQPQTDMNSQPQADSGTQPQTDSGTQPQADSGTQPQTDMSSQPQADMSSQPQADSGTQPQADSGTQPQKDSGTQPQTDMSSQPQADSGTQPQADSGTQPQADSGTQPQTDMNSQPQADSGTQPQADSGTQPQADMNSQPQADSGTQPQADSGTQPQADSGAQPQTDMSSQLQADSGTQPQTDMSSQPQADSGTQPQKDSSTQPQKDSGTQPQADMSSQPQADSGSQPQEDSGAQPQTDMSSQPQADSGTQPQADSGAQPQTDMSSQPQADSGTQPQADSGAQPQTDMSSQPQADSGTQPQTDMSSQPQADSGTQPQKDSGTQPQADMSSQPQADSDTQPQADSGAQPQTDMSSQPQADSVTQPQADSGAQPQTDMSSQPQADSGTQPQADSGAQPQTDMSSQPQADSGTQPQTDMNSQPQADSGTQPQKDSGTQPQADMSSQPQADSDTQPQADSGTQPQTDYGTQPQTGMNSQPQADSGTQPQTDSGTQPQTDMNSQPQADSGTQPQTDSGTQPQADSGTQPQTDMSSQPQADMSSQPQADSGTQPQAGSGTQPQKDSGTQPQTDMSSQPQADSGTQPQADSGTQPQADSGTQPQTDMNSQPQADSGTQPQTDMSSQPQTDMNSQPQTDSGTQPQADSGTQPQTDMSSQPQADSGTQPQADSGTQPQADSGTQPQTDMNSQPQADSGTQPQTDMSSQPLTDMNSQPQADSGTQPQADFGTQPQTDMSSQPQTDMNSQPQADSGTQPQTDMSSHPQTDMNSQPQTDSGTQPHTDSDSQPQTDMSSQPQADTVTHPQAEFDAAIIYAEEDFELADEILNGMNDIVLEENQKAKVCLFDDPRFGAVITDKASEVKKKCNITFILLTKNTDSDANVSYVCKEARMGAVHQEDPESPHAVLTLHTQRRSERDYGIPEGLVNSQHYNWFEPLSGCKKRIATLFSHYRKRAHPLSGHGSNENLKQHSISDGNGCGNKGSSDVAQETVHLKRIKDQTRSILQMCPPLFVPTRAIRDARETLKKEGSVFLVGRSGDGKTYSAYHILTELKKEDSSYEIYIVSKPEDMDHIPPKNSVVFVDNIFGDSSFSSVLFEKWRACFTYMEGYVKTGNMYFIAASQNQVRDECSTELGNVPILKHIIDMSNEYCLSVKEKETMLTKFLQHYEVAMTDKDKQMAVHSKLSLGFPQCCKLYVTNSEAQEHGPSFFEGSFNFLIQKIKKMKSSETDRDKHLYLTLVVGIFEQGKISFERFDPFCKSRQFQPSSEDLNQVCGIEKRITKDDVVSASNKLYQMGYLRCIEENALYEFSHQSIYDAVAVIFGKVHTQQIIDLCPLRFLLDHTAISDGSQVEKKNVITVKLELLIVRLIAELKKGQFSVLGHSALQKERFVAELFFNEKFSEAVKENIDKGLKESNILYYLTASKKYTNFMKRFLEELQKIKSDEAVRKSLLHQILEGSCIAGDFIIFGKVFSMKMITPCQQCFVKAAESPVDHPDIMTKLLSKMSLEYRTLERVARSLVEKGRPKTLRRILESIKWKLFRGKNMQKHLFTFVCLAGNFEMFQLFKEIIGEPYSTRDLLFPAVNGGNMDILEAIITEENINCVDTHGRTILHHACKKGHSLCEFLIKKGIDPDKRDNEGAQAFHIACQYMDEKSIRNLISLGFKVTVTDDGNNRLSPLHRAAKNDRGASLVGLLQKECSTDMIDFPNTQGLTPLHIASTHPQGSAFINELMNRKADHSLKDLNGMTALHHAAAAMNPDNIWALIYHNADVDAVDKSNRTPLHHVLYNRFIIHERIEAQRESVNHLLKKGANVLLADDEGNTAMHVAGLLHIPPETCKNLAEEHVSFELNNEGFSVLHLMLRSNVSAEHFTYMVGKYPKLLQISTKTGDSVLDVALSNMLPFDIFQMLIDKIPGAKESVKWENMHFELTMLQYKSEEVIWFLEQCAENIPKPIPAGLLLFLCERNMSDESWTQAMDCLEVDQNSLSQDGVQSLLHMVYSSKAKITYLVEKGANVNTTNSWGYTPLHVAADHGSCEGVVAFLEAGADINLFSEDKHTALHKAVLNVKFHNEIQFEDYMSVYEKHRHGHTHVHKRPHSISVLEILVEKGGNLDLTTNDGFTCLHLACLEGDEISVRYLFKCMSSQHSDPVGTKCKSMVTTKDIQQTDRYKKILFKEGKDGVLPIHCAVKSGNLAFVKLVTEVMKAAAGKTTGRSSDTRQTKQSRKPKPITPSMRGQGKQVRTRSHEMSLSVIRSECSQTRSTQKPVTSNSPQLNLQTIMSSHEEKHKYTLLQYAVQFSTVEVMQFLLKEGWELNMAYADGNTLLHYAARGNRKEAVEFLLKEKLDVHCFNKEGLMPLHVATESTCNHNKMQCIELLMRDDSVTKLTPKKRNLLHLLCKSSSDSLLTSSMRNFNAEAEYSLTLMPLPWLLIDKGCDVNGTDVDNMTPLHLAAEANNAALVSILLENNAEIDATDIQGRTPLHMALQTSDSLFIKYYTALLLAQQGANPHAIVRSGDTPIDILMNMDKRTIEDSQDIKEICQLFKI